MKIHLLGICGTFMGGIAVLARELGHSVTGSDHNIYPPMSDQLRAHGIRVQDGYSVGHLEPRPDLVVIGNALSRGNPCVEHVLNEGIPYASGPEWLAREVLRGRHVLAVSGTHGKTTGSAMLAWILEAAGQRPGFLIGGVPDNFGDTARLGTGPCFVVEADEYDSAFFDKRSKFVHYRPQTLIINNIEYDHADIFADLEAIRRQFHHLIRTVPGKGQLIVREGDTEIRQVLAQGCWTPVSTFGAGGEWQGHLPGRDAGRFEVRRGGQVLGTVQWGLLGQHNVENALAAIAAAAVAGVDPARSCAALGEFRGVARRLQHLGDPGGVHVYDDFAHHPTAIAATLAALRSRAGAARILAVLEPRSNTMRMGVHRDALPAALAGADEVFVYRPPGVNWDRGSTGAAAAAGRWRVHASVEEIVQSVAAAARSGDNVLIMSNGGFEGIQKRLLARLGA
ncbi:MAG TPA: UDP-N-acetylmuramate:L-alanyl-gamma-D-glutamyl-meso-diaminopimelate ligase [Gammaproteobacteria bacterium]|jgi:UDP-N-acetylmuramate: L-alanyl-gamma-D-glutamyl-meso-diaminopimelate ligase